MTYPSTGANEGADHPTTEGLPSAEQLTTYRRIANTANTPCNPIELEEFTRVVHVLALAVEVERLRGELHVEGVRLKLAREMWDKYSHLAALHSVDLVVERALADTLAAALRHANEELESTCCPWDGGPIDDALAAYAEARSGGKV